MNTPIDAYIAQFSTDIQEILGKIQQTIQRAAPESVAVISYMMPAFKLNGKVLVYFAAYKNHIGFYATPTGHEAFRAELSVYKQGKGSVQFPLDKPIPYELIERIVQFRAMENAKKKPSKTTQSKKGQSKDPQDVDAFLASLEHPFMAEIGQIRTIIKAANTDLQENIKWNAPNYVLNGEDYITMSLSNPKKIQIIFHRGAKKQSIPDVKWINDTSGMLDWKTNDRAIATFINAADIESQKDHFADIVRKWLHAIIKKE
ncbi:MAG: hypothetical protein RIR11_3313 [Bacteroidota bacterium]